MSDTAEIQAARDRVLRLSQELAKEIMDCIAKEDDLKDRLKTCRAAKQDLTERLTALHSDGLQVQIDDAIECHLPTDS